MAGHQHVPLAEGSHVDEGRRLKIGRFQLILEGANKCGLLSNMGFVHELHELKKLETLWISLDACRG